MLSFLRIFRPLNLLIVVGLCFVYFYFLDFDRHPEMLMEWDFWRFVATLILITAGGYVVNDIFDVHADQINKPRKVVVQQANVKVFWGVYIALNLIAIGISFYLHPFVRSFLWLSIVLLFAYSFRWKHYTLVGNLVVAFLAGSLPILVLVEFNTQNAYFIYVYALISLGLTLVREWIKDIEDVQGDAVVQSQNLVQRIGSDAVRLMAFVLALMVLVFSVYQLFRLGVYVHQSVLTIYHAYVLLTVAVPLLWLAYVLLNSKQFHPKDASTMCKYVMATGAGALLFL